MFQYFQNLKLRQFYPAFYFKDLLRSGWVRWLKFVQKNLFGPQRTQKDHFEKLSRGRFLPTG